MHIGDVLRSIRLSQGRTQESVALEVGFSPANLSRLERGQHHVTVERLSEVAAVLKVKVSDIFRTIEVATIGSDRQLREVESSYVDKQSLNQTYDMLDTYHRALGLRMKEELAKAQRATK